MSYIEEKYIKLSCSSMRNYKRKSNLYNFSCPVCMDSVTDARKARGYIFNNKRTWRYKCHNCGLNESFSAFLKRINNPMYNDYIFEKFKDQNDGGVKEQLPTIEEMFNIQVDANINNLALRIDMLPDTHLAKQYLNSRKIPVEKFDQIYYSADINNLKNIFDKEDTEFPLEERLVIPVQNVQNKLVGVVTRAIKKSKSRYINLVKGEEPLIYGLNRLNFSKKKYVVEGPLDSMFIDNCAAVAGADLFKCCEVLDDNTVYIFDNQPRNIDIIKRMKRMADMHKKIVVWPNNIQEKDINDMVLAGIDIENVINKHTYRDLEAVLKIEGWKKR